jgi:putative transposase
MTLYHQLMHSGNPQAAAQMVISLLEKHSPNQVAELMGITVRWVYTLKKRFRDSNGNLASCFLKRGPAAPMPNRTPLHIEKLVVSLAKETNLGPQRLSVLLLQSAGLSLSPYTIRNILRRDQVRCRKYKSVNGNRRYAANLAEFCPLEFWQIDAKHIADQSALPKEAYAAIFKNKLPQYQFTAIDIKTRLRFIAYAHSLSFANGVAFMLLVTSWLKAFGVNRQMFFQTDNGSEFGGKASSRKRSMMQSLIFDPLDVSLLNIPPGQKQANSYVERSHRTDDEEFYVLNLSLSTSVRSFLSMAQN